MKSVNTWFASVSIYSIVVALVLFEFSTPANAQSKRNNSSQFSPQQLDDLQEFARQFKQDASLLPPADEDFEPQPTQNGASNRVPAFGVGYSTRLQDDVKQDVDKAIDPFRDLRPQDEKQSNDDSVFDASPDPPVDESPNQGDQNQGAQNQGAQNQGVQNFGAPRNPVPPNQDQSNPFSDDRAVDNLREPRRQTQPNPKSEPPRRSNEDWERLPKDKPVDEEALRKWELPPGSVEPGGQVRNYQPSAQPTQRRQQPRSSVEPYYPQQNSPQYQPNQVEPSQAQPDYWAQPSHSGSYPQQFYDPYQGGYQGNPYAQQGIDQAYQNNPQYDPHMQGAANAYAQAGQGNYFQNVNNQWGAAGDLGCNSCGISDCGFDCEELEFYLSGYGASVDLKNLVSGSNSLLADNGAGWGVALGRRQGLNLRTELEYGWRSNNIVGFDEDGVLSELTGKIKSQAGMANAYWEFVNFPTRWIKPYVGTGLGFSRFDADLVDEAGNSLTPERSKDSSFAYQFMGGINYQPFSTVDLFIEYRLFRTDSFQLDTETGFASGKYNYQTSNLVGGLRWKF